MAGYFCFLLCTDLYLEIHFAEDFVDTIYDTVDIWIILFKYLCPNRVQRKDTFHLSDNINFTALIS